MQEGRTGPGRRLSQMLRARRWRFGDRMFHMLCVLLLAIIFERLDLGHWRLGIKFRHDHGHRELVAVSNFVPQSMLSTKTNMHVPFVMLHESCAITWIYIARGHGEGRVDNAPSHRDISSPLLTRPSVLEKILVASGVVLRTPLT
ncbi:hypothetical protein PLICRDRAFT_507008 [Plicaturopsis crispa FD-325 SS-3]|nr:hypothetical protein PLICRDRAFT_507008 [Plicaturopsis crispa FD-325 SS-3]